jgi:hypothetical protein
MTRLDFAADPVSPDRGNSDGDPVLKQPDFFGSRRTKRFAHREARVALAGHRIDGDMASRIGIDQNGRSGGGATGADGPATTPFFMEDNPTGACALLNLGHRRQGK